MSEHDCDSNSAIPTEDALYLLGFCEDHGQSFSRTPNVFFRFANLRLLASFVWNERLAEVVLFTGIIRGPNSLGEVEFEMPREVESSAQCAAWIVWHLDQYRDFRAIHDPAWIGEGRQGASALPWVKRKADLRARYDSRPCCQVQRNWLRLGLKALEKALAAIDDDMRLEVGFDGSVLSIRYGDRVVPLQAQGTPWSSIYMVPVKRFREAPGRNMQESIEIEIWEERLVIGRRRYGEILASKPIEVATAM
jgi:hypothetical protein